MAERCVARADQAVARHTRQIGLVHFTHASQRTQLQHAELRFEATTGQMDGELDLHRHARPLHAHLQQGVDQLGEREEAMLQHRRERHQPDAGREMPS